MKYRREPRPCTWFLALTSRWWPLWRPLPTCRPRGPRAPGLSPRSTRTTAWWTSWTPPTVRDTPCPGSKWYVSGSEVSLNPPFIIIVKNVIEVDSFVSLKILNSFVNLHKHMVDDMCTRSDNKRHRKNSFDYFSWYWSFHVFAVLAMFELQAIFSHYKSL